MTGATSMTYSPSSELRELLSRLNRTELYQLCRKNGIPAPPGYPKESYIEWLIDEAPPPIDPGPVDSWREGLIAFIGAYWMKLRPQLKCPAKDMRDVPAERLNPRPCYGCSDAQVLHCVSKQDQPQQKLINDLRPRK